LVYSITLTAWAPGDSGFEVVIVDAGTGNQVVKSGSTFTITVDITGGITANAFAQLVNNASQDSYGYIKADVTVAGAVDTNAVTTGTDLTGGGSTSGLVCYVAGQACTPYHATGGTTAAAAYTDTSVKFTVPDLTALGTPLLSDDAVVISIISGGVRVAEFSSALRVLQQAGDAPTIQYHDQSDGDVKAAGGDFTLVGTGFIQGQTFDSLQITDGSTYDFTIYALKPGVSGYSFVLDDNGAGAAAIVSFAAGVLTVEYDSAAHDCDDIATVINANAAATDGYIRANVTSGGGVKPAAVPATDLTGGKGEGFTVMVGDEECLPQNEAGTTSTAKVTDTALYLTAPNFSNLADDDHAAIYVTSNGVRSTPLSVVVTA
jgi:hypothetical protein